MTRTGVGGFFAYAGMAFALLGALLVIAGLVVGLGAGGAITGGTFLMIGVIWTLVGFGVKGYYAGARRKAAEEAQLFQTGEKAAAVVEGVDVTATRINDNPVVNLTLRVKPRHGADFVHQRRLCVPPNGIPLPGHEVDVAFDPRDQSKVALDVDERLAAAPACYVRTRPPAQQAAPAAAPQASSVVDQLVQLDRLRQSGALTEEEFSAQKAKLLGAP